MLSDLLGYTSITCWLFAQCPQVLENIKNQNCDGLALAFLLNWLAGDGTNLIGAYLTKQLPFQIYLAMYFVSVDLILCIQYFYYRPAKPTRSRSQSQSRRYSVDHHSSAPRYRTLSVVAASVASAAALAAQQDEYTERHSKTRRAHAGTEQSVLDRDDPDEDDSALAALSASFHSEGGRTSRQRGAKEPFGRRGTSHQALPVLGLPALQTVAGSVDSPSVLHDTSRGRSTMRGSDVDDAADIDADTQRRTSRVSRRGASMVFLSMFALLSFPGAKRGFGSQGSSVGRVMAKDGVAPLFHPMEVPVAWTGEVFEPILPLPVSLVFQPTKEHLPHEDPVFNQRVIGRIFAWLCTTLYLTSRLPQIYKNWERKSVEGLSMALFVFAFLGNVFYVLSILTNPQATSPDAAQYLRESMPFLIGSAGTLCFDMTIVGQSFIYRKRKGGHHPRARSRVVEEEEGLLHNGQASLARSKSIDRSDVL